MQQVSRLVAYKSVTIGLLVLAVSLFLSTSPARSAEKNDEKAILESIDKYGDYLIKATFSFLYPISYPPKNESELSTLCKSQGEAIKNLKEKTKGAPPLMRRGFVTFATKRQPHHRKYCTNLNSAQSQKFLAATKCVMEKKFEAFRQADANLAQTFNAIAKRNYNDSNAELKQICCSFSDLKLKQYANIGPECNEHRAIVEELIDEIIGSDINLICDDEEKLAKMCPKLERLKFKQIENYSPTNGGKSTASLALYLITTLGEPNTQAGIN